jgi:hypothetical protein
LDRRTELHRPCGSSRRQPGLREGGDQTVRTADDNDHDDRPVDHDQYSRIVADDHDDRAKDDHHHGQANDHDHQPSHDDHQTHR